MTAAMSVGMSAADLAAVEAHLRADGIFTAYARTDVLRLLAEVHRLRQALADTGRMNIAGQTITARQVDSVRCERLLDDLDTAVRALTLLNDRHAAVRGQAVPDFPRCTRQRQRQPAAAVTVRRLEAGR
jgi:hypothetical protein